MKSYIGTKIVKAESMSAEVARTKGYRFKEGATEGYEVIYPDGYKSWSPKDVFEAAYVEKTGNGLPFGIALEAVKQGKGMRLPQWKEDVVIRMWSPGRIQECLDKLEERISGHYVDEAVDTVRLLDLDEMTAPFLYVTSRFGRVPWKETMIELLSNEWEIVD